MSGGLLVRCRVSGLGAEKLLNEARKRHIPLQSVRRLEDRSLSIECGPGGYRALHALAQEKGFSISKAHPVGMLHGFARLGKRWGLWIGACLCLAALIFSMSFVWRVDVENAGAYAGEVRTFLEEIGVHPGLRRSEINLSDLREKLEWRLPKVKWVRTEWAGVVLKVRLEEGVPPPEVASAGLPGDVVASEDGILTRLTCYAGTPLCKAGDLVQAGQTLIRGEERGSDGQMIPVKAQGTAMARIWRSVQVQAPMQGYETLPTGRTQERRVLKFPFFSFSFQDTPDYLQWDLEIEESNLGGAWLPVRLIRERYWEAAVEENLRNPEEIRREAGKAALQMLEKTFPDEDFVDKWVDYSMIEGDAMIATATAEMERDIARYQKTP